MLVRNRLHLLPAVCGLAMVGFGCAQAQSGAVRPAEPTSAPVRIASPTASPRAIATPVAPSQVAGATPTLALAATPQGTPRQGAVPPGASDAVAAAKNDLVRRAGTSLAAISVSSVSEAEWASSALGCPQPGMVYAQVITPGYRIILSAGGKEYEYHSDRDKNVVFCAQR